MMLCAVLLLSCAAVLSRAARVVYRNRCGFLTPPVVGADLRAALVASCLRGAFPPVDLRAVCLVRAMMRERRRVCGDWSDGSVNKDQHTEMT